MDGQSTSFSMASIAGMGGAFLRDLETVMGGGTRRSGLAAHSSKAIMRGVLTKLHLQSQRSSGPASNKAYTQRGQHLYGVLHPSTKLLLFGNEMDTEPSGCFDLDKMESCIVRKLTDSPTCTSFEIVDTGDPSGGLRFEASSADEADQWVYALTRDTHTGLRNDRDRLSNTCEMLKAEVEALETHAHSLSQYAEQRQKAEEALKNERRATQEIGTAVMRASQHTRTALRTVTQFSQREGLNLEQDFCSANAASVDGKENQNALACSREAECCLKVSREAEVVAERLRASVCTLVRVCAERTEQCKEFKHAMEDLNRAHDEQVQALEEQLRSATARLEQQQLSSIRLQESQAKCAKLQAQKKALVEEVKRLRLMVKLKDVALGPRSPTTVCGTTDNETGSSLSRTFFDSDMLQVELGDVNRPKASFVYDASRFRQSLKAQLTEVLTTQTQALPEAVTPSLDAKKIQDQTAEDGPPRRDGCSPLIPTTLLKDPGDAKLSCGCDDFQQCLHRSHSCELQSCAWQQPYTLIFDREIIGLRFAKANDSIVVHGYHCQRPSDYPLPAVGALLLAFNGQSVAGVKFTDVAKMLRSSGRPLALTFRDPATARTARASSVNDLLAVAARWGAQVTLSPQLFSRKSSATVQSSSSDTCSETDSEDCSPPRPTVSNKPPKTKVEQSQPYILSDLEFAGTQVLLSPDFG